MSRQPANHQTTITPTYLTPARDVGILAHEVDDLPFTFVAPLRSENDGDVMSLPSASAIVVTIRQRALTPIHRHLTSKIKMIQCCR